MEIKNHKLIGENVSFKPTPNTSGEYKDDFPDTIIIHYTAGRSLNRAVSWLTNKKARASAHMSVGFDGEVIQMADLNIITWHAGKSSFDLPEATRTGFNRYAIGIEIVNPGFLTKVDDKYFDYYKNPVDPEDVFEGKHRNFPRIKNEYWYKYPQTQIDKVFEICTALMKEYPNIKYILGHEEIAPDRKFDPGPAFPLDELREKMCVWIPTKKEIGKVKEKLPLGTMASAQAIINFRSGPGINYKTVAETLQVNEKVLVLSKLDEWYEVEQEIIGWVAKDYIDRDDTDNDNDGTVNVELLNIRDKPEGEKISNPLTKGQKVKIFDSNGSWFKVETRVVGWVFGKYIKIL